MERKLVVGLIGYGYWGPNLLRNYMTSPDASVKWVCDRDAAKIAKAKTLYPCVDVTVDHMDILRDSEVDAVLIATPISTHYALAAEALMAGKHVFVEKPMTSSVREAEQLVHLADSRGLTLMVGHTFEYSPPVNKIKEIIDSGELGDIYFITSSRVNLGLHQKDVSVIWDLAPHDFSIVFDWLGEEPMHIQAMGRQCVQYCNPDVAFITMSFPSGTMVEMQLSWLSPIKLRRTLVVGSKKMLMYDDTEAVEKVKIFDHGVRVGDHTSFGEFQLSYRTGDIVSPHLPAIEPLGAEARHFIECCGTGATPKTDGRSGLRVVRALERAELSLQQNGNYIRDPANYDRRHGDRSPVPIYPSSPGQLNIALPA